MMIQIANKAISTRVLTVANTDTSVTVVIAAAAAALDNDDDESPSIASLLSLLLL